MIDVKGPLRTAYYQLLNGYLISGGNPVPVSDSVEKLADTDNLYVLLTQQNGISQNTMSSWHHEETMQIDIVYRGTRVNKATIDNIASQIYMLILPAPNGNGLPPQAGISVINLRMTDDRYLIFGVTGGKNVTRRLITFTQFVSPYAPYGTIPPAPGGFAIIPFLFHFTSADFSNSIDCPIPSFLGKTIEVYWNEDQRFLLKSDGEWTDLAGGGFQVLIPGFDKDFAVYNFYVYVMG